MYNSDDHKHDLLIAEQNLGIPSCPFFSCLHSARSSLSAFSSLLFPSFLLSLPSFLPCIHSHPLVACSPSAGHCSGHTHFITFSHALAERRGLAETTSGTGCLPTIHCLLVWRRLVSAPSPPSPFLCLLAPGPLQSCLGVCR